MYFLDFSFVSINSMLSSNHKTKCIGFPIFKNNTLILNNEISN